jgi:hypothetical protein
MRVYRLLSLALLALPTVALAQFNIANPELIPASGSLGPGCDVVTGDLHFHCVPLYLAYIIQMIFGFTAMICLFMILRAGFEMAFSGFGDRESAKKRIQNALLGLAVCVFAFLIVDFVATTLLSGPTG